MSIIHSKILHFDLESSLKYVNSMFRGLSTLFMGRVGEGVTYIYAAISYIAGHNFARSEIF